MKLILHIVRKDFYRLRWILALWVVLVIAGNVMATLQAHLDISTYLPFRIAALVLGAAFAPLTAFGLVMGLVHDDPVVGGNAFWITRPISGGQLLAAKGLALALLLIVPVPASFPWWLAFRFEPSQLLTAGWRTIQMHIAITFLALPIAVMSRNASRFVLNLMMAAGILVAFAILGVVFNNAGPGPWDNVAPHFRPAAVAWAGAGIAVATNQFLTREMKRSLALLAAGVAFAFGVFWWGSGQGARYAMPDAIGAHSLEIGAPAATGAHGTAAGRSFRIQETQLDFEGNYSVSLSETEPSSPTELEEWVFSGRARRAAPEVVSYRLVHPTDGKVLGATHQQWGGALNLAGVRYTHTVLDFKAQQVSAAWLAEATLTKTIKSAEAQP